MKKFTHKDLCGSPFAALLQLPDAPKQLYVRGDPDTYSKLSFITVVGSRAASPYAKVVVKQLLSKLTGYQVCIVSGLALGIDSYAHKAAIDCGIPTIAFPGSGLADENIYPASNFSLARKILQTGGLLISEYEPETKAAKWTFPKRNRLMAGIADLTIIIEAGTKSGTLITARLATEYNKTVAVVPADITKKYALGSNQLLKDGAYPILSYVDILDLLSIPIKKQESDYSHLGTNEKLVLQQLSEPLPKDDLFAKLNIEHHLFIETLGILELKGLIQERYGMFYIV